MSSTTSRRDTRVAGTGGLKGPEFQIYNPNASILRENMVAQFFNQYSNPVQSNGPGTRRGPDTVPAAGQHAATLISALDLTLTHGTMPAAMNTDHPDGCERRSRTAVCIRSKPRSI